MPAVPSSTWIIAKSRSTSNTWPWRVEPSASVIVTNSSQPTPSTPEHHQEGPAEFTYVRVVDPAAGIHLQFAYSGDDFVAAVAGRGGVVGPRRLARADQRAEVKLLDQRGRHTCRDRSLAPVDHCEDRVGHRRRLLLRADTRR